MRTTHLSWELDAFATTSFEGTVRDMLGSFERYVRVFNPARDPAAPDGAAARTWAEASTIGARATADTQWSQLRADPHLEEPASGDLDRDVAVNVVRILGQRTSTPEECAFLLWRGYAEVDSLEGAPTIQRGHRTDLAIFAGPVTAAVHPEHGRRPMNWRPLDRAWALGNDIYARSVYIGADAETVQAILASPALETALASSGGELAPEDRRA